jgi:hypothetical protein
LGVFTKRYIQIAEKFYFTPTGYINFVRGTNDGKYTGNFGGEQKDQYYFLSANVAPRFAFFPTTKWSFEASLGGIYYSYQKNLTSSKDTNNFSMTFSSGISLSLYYYLSKQK